MKPSAATRGTRFVLQTAFVLFNAEVSAIRYATGEIFVRRSIARIALEYSSTGGCP